MVLYPFPHERKAGLVDATGRVHVAPVYDRIDPASGGRHLMQRGGRYGYLDDTGHEVIAPSFLSARSFGFGWAVVAERPGAYHVIDRDGGRRGDAVYVSLHPVSEHVAVATPVGKERSGLLEIATGTWRIEPTWADVHLASGTRLPVKLGRKWGAVGHDGATVLEARWAALSGNDDGTWIAREKANGPWLRLTPAGEVERTYGADIEDLLPFRGAYASAKQGKLWGLVDAAGTWVVAPMSTMFLRGDAHAPLRICVDKKYGYVRPHEGVVIPATFAEAGDFLEGHAVADGQILDVRGAVAARIDPDELPVVLGAPPAAKGRAARALVAMLARPGKHEPEPEVIAAIRKISDVDLAAVIHTWYAAGMPWIQLGPWELYARTSGAQLVQALRAGSAELPLGSGAYDDPITARFPRGRLEIGIDTNPDDARPRKFSTLDGFVDTMVEDGLAALEETAAWPLPDWLVSFFDAGGVGGSARDALEAHVRRVVANGGAGRDEAAAWLAKHGTPPPDTSQVSLTFAPCEAPVAYPSPPPEVDALLRAGGHVHYRCTRGGTWISVTTKGIRFADAKGKRKTADLRLVSGRGGPSVVLPDDATVLVGGRLAVVRVALATGKKETLFERTSREIAGVCATPSGREIVEAEAEAEFATRRLHVHDLAGERLRDIAIPEVRFVDGLFPVWDDLVVVLHQKGALVVDVAKAAVVGIHGSGVKEARVTDGRLTLTDYLGRHVELVRT